jgi:carboxyl-terminal processing protease
MALRLPLLLVVLFSWPAFAESPTNTKPTNAQKPATNKVSVLPLEDLRVFTKAYEHIRSNYVKEIDDKTLLEYAIRGMLEQLDPHSVYLDSSSYEDLQEHTTGEFGGLGIEIGVEDGAVRVITPVDDSPAQLAGILPGDLIIKVDGTALKESGLSDAVQRMRGPKGTSVVLTIVRKNVPEPFDVTLVRDVVKVRSVRSEVFDNAFLYIRIGQFQVNTGQDLSQLITSVKAKHALKGVILDLRNNPGGVLQASVEVADAFLNSGTVVYTEGRMPQSNVTHKATEGELLPGLPLIVLINEGSASASEIVAGALQDHGRALLMGTRSFGKGSVQSVVPITDERAIKLTTALYFTPKGRSIQAEGIQPDIQLELVKRQNIEAGESISEAQLSGHLNNAKPGAGEPKSKTEKSEKSAAKNQATTTKTASTESYKNRMLDKDSQLFEALNVLRGMAFFKQPHGGTRTPEPKPATATPAH